MTTETLAASRRVRSRPRAELILAILAAASLVLIPVRITTIYSGLPAHPLFLHVPVILIPVVTIGALLLVARPRWFARAGVPLAAVTVVALAGTFVTIGAGLGLRNALHLNGAGGVGPAAEIARHAHAGSILRDLMIAFTALLIAAVLAHRVAAGLGTGEAAVDRVLRGRGTLVTLRALTAVLAVACGYFVFHTGDLGAKAVWQGRLSNRAPFGAPGGFASPQGSAGGARRPYP